MKTTLAALYARRIPDPTQPKAERHILMCPVAGFPADIPLDGSNPRAQNIDRKVYKEVAASLRNEDCERNTFHLKNKGITILAGHVQRDEESENTFHLTFADDKHGIVDGGHTYRIIQENQGAITQLLEDPEADYRQFVKVEVLTGLDLALVPEIAGGLNTAVQVTDMSLANLDGQFDWIRKELEGTPMADAVAYRDNEDRPHDVRDILVLLELFNIEAYPNEGAGSPVRAFTSKGSVLSAYMANKEPYERLRPILRDILILHDTVSSQARELYNDGGGKKGGRLVFVEGPAKRTKFPFAFIGKAGDYRLCRGALFPILGAFRWMVVKNPTTGTVEWRGGFEAVLALWKEEGQQLMMATRFTSDELGRNPNAIGKSVNHWKTLYSHVAMKQMVKAKGAGE